MKSSITTIAISAVCILLLSSCNALPLYYPLGNTWQIPESSGTAQQTIKLAGVSVDRSGGWDSLEKEAASLAPLFFWEEGYQLIDSGPADYTVHINLREREYMQGWKTKRSLAIEVRMWQGDTPAEDLSGRLPAAAARVVAVGSKSFSSSDVTGKMLSRAISRTASQLPAAPQEN